jgi:hypothetical protein
MKSPEVGEDGKVTFRILAAEAEAVRLASSDLPVTPHLVCPFRRGLQEGVQDARSRIGVRHVGEEVGRASDRPAEGQFRASTVIRTVGVRTNAWLVEMFKWTI